jgi:hypothetical protein
MKRFNEFINIIKEDVDVATIKKMTEDQFKELLKRSTASRRNQLNTMRQSNSMRMKPQAQPPRVAPKLPTSPPPSAATTTTRPSLLKRVAPGAAKLGAYVALDTAAEVGISKIKDPKTRERVAGAKELGLSALAMPYYTAGRLGSGGSIIRDRDLEIKNYFGQGGTLSKSFSRGGGRDNNSMADWLKSDLKGGTLPPSLGGAKAGPKYNDPKTSVRYTPKGGTYKDGIRIGAAKQDGEIIPVEWGAVAGEKKVGTPKDVAAVKARQKAGQQGAYGSRQGVGIVGTGGKMDVDKKNNTITSGGKTAKLPSTKILSGGRVGDLAYKNGKPVYLARASMAQRGNQNLFSRLSRATGIGGQRKRDAAALTKERQQATKNTIKYRKEIGTSGGSISAK